MCETHWENLSIDFDLVTIEHGSPIDILCPKDDRLLIFPMLQDSHMQGLIEFDKH